MTIGTLLKIFWAGIGLTWFVVLMILAVKFRVCCDSELQRLWSDYQHDWFENGIKFDDICYWNFVEEGRSYIWVGAIVWLARSVWMICAVFALKQSESAAGISNCSDGFVNATWTVWQFQSFRGRSEQANRLNRKVKSDLASAWCLILCKLHSRWRHNGEDEVGGHLFLSLSLSLFLFLCWGVAMKKRLDRLKWRLSECVPQYIEIYRYIDTYIYIYVYT